MEPTMIKTKLVGSVGTWMYGLFGLGMAVIVVEIDDSDDELVSTSVGIDAPESVSPPPLSVSSSRTTSEGMTVTIVE